MDVKFSPRLPFAVLAATLGVLVLAPMGARAEEDDGKTFEQRMIHKLMIGIGATDGTDDSGIEYRERSPLVVPQNLNLPAPEQAGATPAPNWPKDPDVTEAKARRAAAATQKSKSDWEEARPLTPDELAKGRNPNAGRVTSSGGIFRRDGDRLSAKELGYKGDVLDSLIHGTKKEAVTFKGEPPRTSLTAPPVGYQTPSPQYSYGEGEGEKTALPQQEGKPIAPGRF